MMLSDFAKSQTLKYKTHIGETNWMARNGNNLWMKFDVVSHKAPHE